MKRTLSPQKFSELINNFRVFSPSNLVYNNGFFEQLTLACNNFSHNVCIYTETKRNDFSIVLQFSVTGKNGFCVKNTNPVNISETLKEFCSSTSIIFVNLEIDFKNCEVNFQEASNITNKDAEVSSYIFKKTSRPFAVLNIPNNKKLEDVVVYSMNTFIYILTKNTNFRSN